MPYACTLTKVCIRQAQPRLHVDVTGGALAPIDTHQRHQVIVWPGQCRRGVLQSDCLILLIFVCTLNFFASCTNPGDVIAFPCDSVRLKHLCYTDDIGQLSTDARAATDQLTRFDQHRRPVELDISGVRAKSMMFKVYRCLHQMWMNVSYQQGPQNT